MQLRGSEKTVLVGDYDMAERRTSLLIGVVGANKMDRAELVIAQLKQGNERFVKGEFNGGLFVNPAMRPDQTTQQCPAAIILGCSDSRVPPEVIFDQDLGVLFVVRVAGNVLSPVNFGSIEFSVDKFNTPVVVVLGHSNCGAVTEAVQCALRPNLGSSDGFSHHIINWILPSIQTCQIAYPDASPQALIDYGVRANVTHAVQLLKSSSELLSAKVKSGQLKIVGAEYSLTTGKVDFFV